LFTSLRRRLVLSYAAIFTISLLLLGPVLYLSFAQQLDDGFDTTLRLAAQRQALRAFVPSDVTLGINPYFTAPPPLANTDTFYLLLDQNGRVQDNPSGLQHAGLPDQAGVRAAVRQGHGVFSTLATRDAGDVRLFTTVVKRGGRVKAVLQAGQPLAPLVAARHRLLYLLLALGAGAVAIAAAGGVVLTRQPCGPSTRRSPRSAPSSPTPRTSCARP